MSSFFWGWFIVKFWLKWILSSTKEMTLEKALFPSSTPWQSLNCHLVGTVMVEIATLGFQMFSLIIIFLGRTNVNLPLICPTLRKMLSIRVIWKVTLSLGLLSPSIPFLSGIGKLMKFYQISVWNAETRHLMHKVQE